MSRSPPTGPYSDSIDRYAVWVHDKSTPLDFPVITGYPASARDPHLAGLKPGHEYIVLVCARNASGEGKPSTSGSLFPR